MPELPEVETIRRGLQECMPREKAGRILKVTVLEPKSLIGDSGQILGALVTEFDRRGKALIIHLTDNQSLIIHLRMTGQLVFWDFSYYEEKSQRKESSNNFESKSAVSDSKFDYDKMLNHTFGGGHPTDDLIDLPNKHTRVIIEFERGKLFFNDQRKFGFIKIVPTEEVGQDAFIRKLAKEPWEMTGEELYEKLQRHKGSAVKSVILDQTVICGLGNIYADEALYYAEILPMRRAGSLSLMEAKKLVEGARVVMERSLEAGGSTLKNYVKADGTKGDYLTLFAEVFNRQGLPCRKCGEKIIKTKVGGRGTHYCPKCQK